ncbi:MAG: MFS transporter [Patescibacteria group bacterium]
MSTFSCFFWSLFTGIGALATSFPMLLGSRVLLGMGEAPIFPSNAKVVRKWFPLEERGRATALFDSGSYIGAAIAAPLIIYLMLTFGWRYTFAIFSFIGIIWSIVWFIYYRDPDEFKNLSSKEKAIISSTNKESLVDEITNISIIKLIRNRKIIGISLGFFCYNYLKSFFLTWFPSYLIMEKGFDLIHVGFIAMIPPLAAIGGELFVGYLTDKMIMKNIDVSLARKIPLCLGMLFSSIVILSVFTENIWVALTLLTISYTSLISASP